MGKYSSAVLKSVLKDESSLWLTPGKSEKQPEFSEKGSLKIPDSYNEVVREILTIFTLISKRYEPVNEKGAAICDLLDLYGIDYYKQEVPNHEYNIVTLASEEVEKVIMSHYDLISLFNAGFLASDCLRFDGDEIQGALDNTITNAVVLYMLKNKLIPANTSVVFSVEEERGGAGAKEFMKRLQNKESVAFINLDVTNEFKDCDRTGMSIEYDAYSIQNIPLLWDFCSVGFSSVTFDRVGDDMCTILQYGGRGASFCLPTKKGIHSFKNKTTADKLYKYTLELGKILNSDINFSLSNESRRVSISTFKSTRGLTVEEILAQFKPVTRSQGEFGLFDRDWSSDVERSVFGSDNDEDYGEIEEALSQLADSWSDDARGSEGLAEALNEWIVDEITTSELRHSFVKANKVVGGKWFHKFLEEANVLKDDFTRENITAQHPFDDDDDLEDRVAPMDIADAFVTESKNVVVFSKHIEMWKQGLYSDMQLESILREVSYNIGEEEVASFWRYAYSLLGNKKA